MFRYIPLFSHSTQLDCSRIPRLIDWLLTIAVRVELCGKEIYFNWVNKKMPFYRTSEIRLLLSACSPDHLLSLKRINIFNREYFSHIIPIPATDWVALVAFMADWQLLRSRPQVKKFRKDIRALCSFGHVKLDEWVALCASGQLMLNCKINSTNRGTFSNSVWKIILMVSMVQGV